MSERGVKLFAYSESESKSARPVVECFKDNIVSEIKSWVVGFGRNKNVPKELESSFFTALAYYPELKDSRIIVRYKNIKTTMQCRPRWDFMFHRRANRTYVIYVDQRIKTGYGVSYYDLPLNAQIGVFGHELAHVVDYTTMGNLQIIRFGIDYLNHSKRKRIENSTDLTAVEKGLGYQIIDFAKCVFDNSEVSKAYLKYKLRYYFMPEQIEGMLTRYPIYSQNDQLRKNKS